MNILIINSGSSSLKYQLFRMPEPKPVCSGIVERIGKENSSIRHKVQREGGEILTERQYFVKDHAEGFRYIMEVMTDAKREL